MQYLLWLVNVPRQTKPTRAKRKQKVYAGNGSLWSRHERMPGKGKLYTKILPVVFSMKLIAQSFQSNFLVALPFICHFETNHPAIKALEKWCVWSHSSRHKVLTMGRPSQILTSPSLDGCLPSPRDAADDSLQNSRLIKGQTWLAIHSKLKSPWLLHTWTSLTWAVSGVAPWQRSSTCLIWSAVARGWQLMS